MDPSWRWRSMSSKGPDRVAGYELAFAISNAGEGSGVESGLEALAKAWGADELARMLGEPMSAEAPTGSWSPKKGLGSTVMGQVALEIVATGAGHPGWGKLGAMLDFGGNPESAPRGCRSPIDQMCSKVQYGMDSATCVERQAVGMMLSKCESAADGEWIAMLSEEYPAVAILCAREWALRQKSAIEAIALQGEAPKELAPRL